MIKFLYLVSVFIILISSQDSFAVGKNLQLRQSIKTLFLDSSGLFSEAKVSHFVNEIKDLREQLFRTSYNSYLKLEQKSSKKALEEALDKVTHYDNFIIPIAEKFLIERDLQKRKKMAIDLIKMRFSLRFRGLELDSVRKLKYFMESLKKRKIDINNIDPVEKEARNLTLKDDPLHLTIHEIRKLQAKGEDLSLLEPYFPESHFMDDVKDISQVDVRRRYLFGEGSSLYKDVEIRWPEEMVFKFKKIRRSQSKPKMDLTHTFASGVKETYKLKVGFEIHSDPTGSALLSALGFFYDISRYERNIKVYVGKKKNSIKEFKKEWNSYYREQKSSRLKYDVNRYILETGRDEQGYYIIFIEGLIEHKLKNSKLYRLGPWAYGGQGNKRYRENRGLFIFNTWINNTDLKESENNKLIGKWDENGSYKLFQMQHDMGFGFGKVFREKPFDFEAIAAQKIIDKIQLNIKVFQPNSGFSHVTYADARWMARKISMLTEKQIQAAVTLGGWPEFPVNLSKLIFEKLKSRRNSFVTAFNLEGEVLENGKVISLFNVDKEFIKEINKTPNNILQSLPGYTQSFEREPKEIWVHPIIGVRDALASGINLIAKGVNKVTIPETELGFDDGIISEVLLNSHREIIKNPKPQSANENFLVKDSFTVGARLGAGYVVSGSIAIKRQFTIIYPAQNKKEALFNKNFIVDLTLPFVEFINNLPSKYVLTIEDHLEGRGRIKLGPSLYSSPIGPALSFENSYVNLGRTIISRKDNKSLRLYKDESQYNESVARLLIDASILRFPIGRIGRKDFGRTKQWVTTFSLKDFKDQEFREGFHRYLIAMEEDDMSSFGATKNIESRFREKYSEFKFFSALSLRTDYQEDQITVTTLDKKGKAVDKSFYTDISENKKQKWSFLDNGEEHNERVRFYAETNEEGQFEDHVLKVSYRHNDKSAQIKEFEKSYFPFLNGVAGEPDFLWLDLRKLGQSDLFGPAHIGLDLEIYESGLQAILEMDESTILNNMFTILNLEIDQKKAYILKEKSLLDGTLIEKAALTIEQKKELVKLNQKILNLEKHYLSDEDKQQWQKFSIKGLESFIPLSRWQKRNAEALLTLKQFTFYLKRAQQKKDAVERVKKLIRAFFVSVHRKSHSFSPYLLGAIVKSLKLEDYWLSAAVRIADDVENKFPEKIKPYNEKGVKKAKDLEEYYLRTRDTYDVWANF